MDHEIPRKVLSLVQELHRRGFERLRIAPGMSPSGMHWRCVISPISNISPDHGALMIDWNGLVARYTTGDGAQYFGWPDGDRLSVSELADLFIERFAEIVEAGRGSDPAYAAWYQEMMDLTAPDAFPVAYDDCDLPEDYLKTVGGRQVRVPLPPLKSSEASSAEATHALSTSDSSLKAGFSFRALFEHSRFCRVDASMAGPTRDRRELFSVAAIAMAVKHEPKFARHFLSKVCGISEPVNLTDFEIALQPHHHTDLAIKDPKHGRIFVVEFKFHGHLKEKQDPERLEFTEKGSGYGYLINHEPAYASYKERHYVVIQKAWAFENQNVQGIQCRSLAWKDLDVKAGLMGALVDDILDSLGEMGIPSLRFRHLNGMNRSPFTIHAVDMHQVCEAIAAELQVKQSKNKWEIGREGNVSWYGMDLPLGLKALGKIEKLSGAVNEPWAWFGYQISKEGKPQLALWIYASSDKNAERTRSLLEERLPKAGGYRFPPIAEKGVQVTAEGSAVADDKHWFSSTFDRLR